MRRLDALVLDQLAERDFTPQRLRLMLSEAGLNRLYEGVESGFLPFEETLRRRV